MTFGPGQLTPKHVKNIQNISKKTEKDIIGGVVEVLTIKFVFSANLFHQPKL